MHGNNPILADIGSALKCVDQALGKGRMLVIIFIPIQRFLTVGSGGKHLPRLVPGVNIKVLTKDFLDIFKPNIALIGAAPFDTTRKAAIQNKQ